MAVLKAFFALYRHKFVKRVKSGIILYLAGWPYFTWTIPYCSFCYRSKLNLNPEYWYVFETHFVSVQLYFFNARHVRIIVIIYFLKWRRVYIIPVVEIDNTVLRKCDAGICGPANDYFYLFINFFVLCRI